MKICGIYKITNPRGHVYIGMTTDFNRRYAQYKNGHFRSQPKIKMSIEKYGFEAHSFEVIEKVDRENLVNREIYWIGFFDSFRRGLNANEGGNAQVFTEETRRKLSQSLKGKKKTEQHSKKVAQSRRLNGNMKWSEASKAKLSNSRIGMKLSEQHKKNIAASNLGRKFSDDIRQKLSAKMIKTVGKKIDVFNSLGQYLFSSDAIAECARFLISAGYSRVNHQNIIAVCSGRIKSCGGLKFKYADV